MTQDSNNDIQPIEQKTVLFYDDQLVAVRAADEQIYVSVRHLCDVLGLNRNGQVQRIRRNGVLQRGYKLGPLETEGGTQTAGLLRVDLLPLWLAGLSTRSVREEMRPRIELYQDQAAKVLWEAFQSGRLSTDTRFDDLLQTDSPAVQAYKMAQAMMQLAQNQIILEAGLQEQQARLAVHDDQLSDYGNRIEQIEETLGNADRHITPAQASQVSQAVKAVAMKLGEKTGKNEYGGVYGELYRKFGITSYKLLPAKKFEEAMAFLSEWYGSLTDEELPF